MYENPAISLKIKNKFLRAYLISNMAAILIPQSMCLVQFILIYKKKYKNSFF